MFRGNSWWMVGALASLLGLQGLPARVSDGPVYAADGRLQFPKNYREWVFLASGLNMSYTPGATSMGEGVFDNVFVNPEAYKTYQASGHWPEGTELVLENRGAEAAKSINKLGRTQAAEVLGIEVHVLDSAHQTAKTKGDGWAFYAFRHDESAAPIARPASCYTCHEEHGAVDTTFVQFYPTLLDAAQRHKTLSAAYLKELSTQ